MTAMTTRRRTRAARAPKTPTPAQPTPAHLVTVTEAQFQAAVIDYARLRGYLVYHEYDSRRTSERGYPDLTLLRVAHGSPRTLFIELKTARGRLRKEQKLWMDGLRAAGQEAYIWRPGDWTIIEEVLG